MHVHKCIHAFVYVYVVLFFGCCLSVIRIESLPVLPTTPLAHNQRSMGCLRLVGSLKLYVSFAEYSLFCGALLQKRSFAKETYNFKEPTNRSHPIIRAFSKGTCPFAGSCLKATSPANSLSCSRTLSRARTRTHTLSLSHTHTHHRSPSFAHMHAPKDTRTFSDAHTRM